MDEATKTFVEYLSQYTTENCIYASEASAYICCALIKYRCEHKMSKAQFANFMNISKNKLNKWESDFDFTLSEISQICDKMGLKIKDIFNFPFPVEKELIDEQAENGFIGTCPNCHKPVDCEYCSNCGQHLKWE